MWNPLVWLDDKRFPVIIMFYPPQYWVHRGSHTGKDQIVVPKDKWPDLSSLQAPLWRNNELSEYQQESHLSPTPKWVASKHT